VSLENLQKLDLGRGASEEPRCAKCFFKSGLPVLDFHPNKKFAEYIHKWLTHGFQTGFSTVNMPLKSSSHNHLSAATPQSIVSKYIKKEVRLGRLVGQSAMHMSLILVPQEGKW